MLHDIFGEITFDIGWKRESDISLFGKNYTVKLKIQAYFEEDGITQEQEKSYLAYREDEAGKLHAAEALLRSYSDAPTTRFCPKTLLFGRDGSCALLFDDVEEPEEGIAVCLLPEEMVVSQDEYL